MGKNKYYCRIDGVVHNLSDVQELIGGEMEHTIPTILMNDHGVDFPDCCTFLEVLEFNNNEIPADYNEALERLRNHNRERRRTPHCPKCDSTAVSAGPLGYWGFAALSSSTMNRCANCGHSWYPD